MLDVKIENIIPYTEARDAIGELTDKVANSDDLYVLTKNGKPAAILVGVHHLETLTDISHKELIDEENDLSKEVSMTDDMNDQIPAAQQPADLNADSNQENMVNAPAEEAPISAAPTLPQENLAPTAPAVESADTSVNEPMSFTPAADDNNFEMPAAAPAEQMPVENAQEDSVMADSPINEPVEEVPVNPVPAPDAQNPADVSQPEVPESNQ